MRDPPLFSRLSTPLSMRILHPLRVGAALLIALAPSVAMSAKAPVIQPNNGFFQSANPEWVEAHSDSSSYPAEHRQYHREAQAELHQWMADRSDEIGTNAHADSLRVVMQRRNLLHRLWHAGKEAAMMPGASAMMAPSFTPVSDSSRGSIITDRYFRGHMPSRRTLRNETERRQALFSQTAGQR